MKLISVRVRDFWSVRDSNQFAVGDITCLVGKNEAGKTAILQALYRLNPIVSDEGKFDVTDDFPRADVEEYQQSLERKEREHAIVVKADYSLDDNEVHGIEEEFGDGVCCKKILSLSKGYDNKIYIGLQVNEKIAIKKILEETQAQFEHTSIALTIENFEKFAACVQEEKENESNKGWLSKLKNKVLILAKEGLAFYIYQKHLKNRVPKFLYFDEYYQMSGQVNIETLKTRIAQKKLEKSDYPLLGLISLARLSLDELINPQRTEWLINKLEGAGNHLSKKILNYWSQNKHLHMQFDVRPGKGGDPQGMTTGTNLWARVYDSKHLVTTRFGSRSRGFIWFFSFLAWFDQEQKKNEPLILLLDEPGLLLHGKAQGDLLRYLEKELLGNQQVLYTTHSPFMVDPQHFERVRIVQDKSMEDETLPIEDQGSKVFTDILEATDDSLFPLQGALGYEIHQSLFIGPNCLVVEGVSDLLYIQTISGILAELKRESLNQNWVITPVGGADKLPTFISLLGSQRGIKIATLVDIQKKDQQKIENLYKRKLLKKKNVITFGDIIGKDEADIEDLFGDEFYLRLVSEEYGSVLSKPIAVKNLISKELRILVKLEKYLKETPLPRGEVFSHYRPARCFVENIVKYKELLSRDILDKFEQAFHEVNKLL